VAVVRGEVERLVIEADRLMGVALVDGRVISRVAVFIRPVNVPHDDGLLAGLGCDLDPAGFRPSTRRAGPAPTGSGALAMW
jgi:hypothetical protein